MNPQDIIAMAKEIFIRRVVDNTDWDKQKIAREAIESAKQFSLALQYEKEGIGYSTDVQPGTTPPAVTPTASTGPSYYYPPHWVSQSADQHMGEGNQQAEGRGRVQQLHSGLGLG